MICAWCLTEFHQQPLSGGGGLVYCSLSCAVADDATLATMAAEPHVVPPTHHLHEARRVLGQSGSCPHCGELL